MTNHKHRRAYEGSPYAFDHCLSPECNPVAHGNVSVTVFCRCGASRQENRNGGFAEAGPWREKKYSHFSNFGVTVQPQTADGEGYLPYREGFHTLPRGQWTDAEEWIEIQSQRIDEWNKANV